MALLDFKVKSYVLFQETACIGKERTKRAKPGQNGKYYISSIVRSTWTTEYICQCYKLGTDCAYIFINSFI